MILIERIKKLFQRKKKITEETRSISYIKNMMIIRTNQLGFYEVKKYLDNNDYLYFVFYDNLRECSQSIVVYNIPAMYFIEQLNEINKNLKCELYTFDETHHRLVTNIYFKGKLFKGNIIETDIQNDYLSEVMKQCKFTLTFFNQVAHIRQIISNRDKNYDVNQLLNNSIDSTRSERNRRESRNKLYFSAI